MNPERKKNPAIVAIIVIVLLAIAGGAIYVATRPVDSNKDTQSTMSDSTSEAAQTPEASRGQSAGTYTNGTYEATGSYSTPGGRESVDLTVTIADGAITATEIDGSATSGDSLQYQTRFINNYKSMVVGKNVDEVSLSRVAGSSLTSNGFNDALEQIKLEAGA